LNGSQGTTAAVSRARMHLDQFRHQLDAGSTALLEAEIALARGDVAMAQFHAAAATVVAPDSAAAHYLLGVARYRAGEPALARKEWMAALEADSDYIPAQLAMGERALAEGDAAEAEEQAAAVVREEPANLQALLLYARALAAGKQRDAAAAVAGRAAMLDAFAPEPHLILGTLAVEQHRLGAALLEFEQAVLLSPHAADAVEGLMQVYRRGRVDRAALLGMEAAAEREPRSATLLEITGRLFAEHGWTSDAQRCLGRALALDPARATAADALTRVLAAGGNLDRAAELMAHRNAESAALLEATRAQQRGDLVAAIRNYEFAVRHGERTGVAANNLAWIYAEQGAQLDRALALAQTAHDLAPRSAAVMDTIGIVYMARREYTQSVQALEAAQRLLARVAPADGERRELGQAIQQHLTQAYLHAGQPEAAARVGAQP